jgi:poly-beta-1,6-N-acetyl-D-glucosamine synthase
MNAPKAGFRYILISPIKDEEKYVDVTIRAVLRQTVRPYRWVFVDDGSRDGTHQILESVARRVDWITVLTIHRDATRLPGSGIIRAFNEGFRTVQDEKFDFIVKLDCDIDFPPDYFERLIARFQQDVRLGIASGIYLERPQKKWIPIKMPAYHAAGQTKMVRMECFREIGGFVASRGWDSFDEIKAQSAGWITRHFEEIQFYHLKLEGSGIGFLRTSKMLGEVYYLTGGGPLFFVLKCLYYVFSGKPFFLGSVMMLFGYLQPLLARRHRLVTSAEAKLYRRLLNRRIVDALCGTLSLRRFRRREVTA